MASRHSVKRSRSVLIQRRLSEIIHYLGGSYNFDDNVKDTPSARNQYQLHLPPSVAASTAVAMPDAGGSHDNSHSILSRKQRAQTLGAKQPALLRQPSAMATRFIKRTYSLDRRSNRPASLAPQHHHGIKLSKHPRPSPSPRATPQSVRVQLDDADMDLVEESESDIDFDNASRVSRSSDRKTRQDNADQKPEQEDSNGEAKQLQEEEQLMEGQLKNKQQIEKQVTEDEEWTDWLKSIVGGTFADSADNKLKATSLRREPNSVRVDISYGADGEPVDASVRLLFDDGTEGCHENDATKDASRARELGDEDEMGDAQEPDYLLSATVPVDMPYENLNYEKSDKLSLNRLCCPPPIFMLLISALEIGMFYTQESFASMSSSSGSTAGNSGSGRSDFSSSQLVYNPCKRNQAWPRFLMYILAHDDLWHLVGNVVAQVFLGFTMELVHKWRIPVIYLGSAVGGCLLHSVLDGNKMVYGASGGVFGLIGARIAEIVLIRRRMTLTYSETLKRQSPRQIFKRVLCGRIGKLLFALACCSYAIGDFLLALLQRLSGDIVTTSFGAHFGGLIVGTLLGIFVLREHEKDVIKTHYYTQLQNTDIDARQDACSKESSTPCSLLYASLGKNKLKLAALCLLALFVLFTVCWNALYVTFSTVNSTLCLQATLIKPDSADGDNDYRQDLVEKKTNLPGSPTGQFTGRYATSTARTPTATAPVHVPSNGTTIAAAFLLVSDMSAGIIYQLDAGTGQSFVVASGETRPTAVAYDPKVTKVFWTDVATNTLTSCNLDSSGKTVIYRFPYGPTSDGLAVSVEDQRVYYTNSGGPVIGYVTYDGSHSQVIIRAHLSQPRAIALLPHAGTRLVIFSDWGYSYTAARIWRANMDTGADRRLIISAGIVWPNGLTVDTATNQIFWCDAATNKIEVVDVDGQNRRELVFFPQKHFFGIAIDSQWIYTSSWKDRIVTKHWRQASVGDAQSMQAQPVSRQMFNQQGAIAIGYK